MEQSYFLISIIFAVAMGVSALMITLVGGIAFIRIAQSAVKATNEFAEMSVTIREEHGVINKLEQDVQDILNSDVTNTNRATEERGEEGAN